MTLKDVSSHTHFPPPPLNSVMTIWYTKELLFSQRHTMEEWSISHTSCGWGKLSYHQILPYSLNTFKRKIYKYRTGILTFWECGYFMFLNLVYVLYAILIIPWSQKYMYSIMYYTKSNNPNTKPESENYIRA